MDANKVGFDILDRKNLYDVSGLHVSCFHIKTTSTTIKVKGDGTGSTAYYASLYQYPT